MKYYWNEDKTGVLTIMDWQEEQFENNEDLEVLTDEEVVLHLKPPTPPLTIEMIEQGIDNYINSVAKSRRYDSIISARSYAGYPNAFQGEAIALGIWSSSVWEESYAIMGKIQAGEMEMPKTLEEGIAMLPKFEE